MYLVIKKLPILHLYGNGQITTKLKELEDIGGNLYLPSSETA